MISLLLAFVPLLCAVATIVIFRQSALRAGLVGLGALVVIILAWPVYHIDVAASMVSLSVAASNLLNISLVLFGGVLLYRVLDTSGALATIADGIVELIREPVHQVFALVFGAAVFFESATGFGVGIVVVAPLFIALGYTPIQAGVLALLGQCAVPWGALSIGTVIGEELSGVPLATLGAQSALYTLPVALIFGFVALRTASLFSAKAMWLLFAYAFLLSFLLWICTVLLGVELAGCVAGLLVLLTAIVVSSRSSTTSNKPVPDYKAFLPFIVLLLALCISRLVSPVSDFLNAIELSLPGGNKIAPFYHAGFYLTIAAIAGLLLFPEAQRNFKSLSRQAFHQWLTATLAIGGFILLGQLMLDSGMTTQIASSLVAGLSEHYIFVVPFIGALGGFLTASNAASNALFMVLQTEAAIDLDLPVDVVASAQNASGSNVTLASPGRLVFAATVVGQAGAESILLSKVALATIAGVVSASIVAWCMVLFS